MFHHCKALITIDLALTAVQALCQKIYSTYITFCFAHLLCFCVCVCFSLTLERTDTGRMLT